MKILLMLFTSFALVAKPTSSAKIYEPTKPKHTSAAVAVEVSGKSIIVIDPKARAKDFVEAFSILRKSKPTVKVTVKASSGDLFNVTSVKTTEGGTLLVVKYMTTQGHRTEIIPVEHMLEISYSI